MECRRVIHLVRHGQSQWNVQRRVQGQTPHVPLTRRGHEQARAVADRLAGTDVVAVFSSDLRRAVDTAGPIAQQLNLAVTTDPALREQALGVFEGMPSDTVFAAVGAEAKVDLAWRPPGGESLRDVDARVRPFLRRVFATTRDGAIVIVTHGDTARVVAAALQGKPLTALPDSVPANGEIITVVCKGAPSSHDV